MTQYEAASLTVSCVAVLLSVCIPLVQFAYIKMQRPCLQIIPFDVQPLTLNYDLYGFYARLAFSIQCERSSCVVKSVRLRIGRSEGKWFYASKWLQLKPINASWMSAGAQQALLGGATLVHPVKIEAGKLEPLNVEFEARGGYRHQLLVRKVCDAVSPVYPESQDTEDVLSNQSVRTAMANLRKSCPWTEGRYIAEITVCYDASDSITQQYRFCISKRQANCLRGNAAALAGMSIPSAVPGRRQQLQTLSLGLEIV